MAIFWREAPNGGVECRRGRHQRRYWTNGWLSIDDCSVIHNIDSHRCSNVSQLRCTSVYGTDTAGISEYAKEKRTEFYLYAVVNLKSK